MSLGGEGEVEGYGSRDDRERREGLGARHTVGAWDCSVPARLFGRHGERGMASPACRRDC